MAASTSIARIEPSCALRETRVDTNHWAHDDNDLASLNRLAQKISFGNPLCEILEEAVKFVTTVTRCDDCMIYSLDERDLVLRASTKTNPGVLSRLKVRVGQGAAAWVTELEAPILIPVGARKDPRFKSFRAMLESGCEALLAVPMVVGGRAVGIIHVFDREEHWYGQRDVGLITTLGFLLGTELERIRLEKEYSEIERKIKNRTIFERAKKILQEQLHISEEEAYLTLQRESKRRRKPMNELAEAIALSEDLRSAGQAKSRGHVVGSPVNPSKN